MCAIVIDFSRANAETLGIRTQYIRDLTSRPPAGPDRMCVCRYFSQAAKCNYFRSPPEPVWVTSVPYPVLLGHSNTRIIYKHGESFIYVRFSPRRFH